MLQKLENDIYVFLFYNEKTSEINFQIAQSLEDFQKFYKKYDIITWANITGKEMEINEFVHDKSLKFISDKIKEKKNAN